MKNLSYIALLLLTSHCATIPSPNASSPEASETISSPRKNDAIAQVIGKEATNNAPAKGSIETPPAPPPVVTQNTQTSNSVPVTTDTIDKETSKSIDVEGLTIDEVIRIEEPNTQNLYDNSRYDFPITMNSRVESWIDYFAGRGRPHMERYLARSSRYIPMMRQIFKKSGLPEDLVYVALIESGFNMRANSRARAVGPWQFIKGTGKKYGLRVDAWIDERRDPLRSTEAAAKYLKDLYLMFESWYLAAAGYNAGEYRVLRAIEQLKTNNFWRLSETRLLRRETKDYIPKLIAAAIIAKNPGRYGFQEVEYQEPLAFDNVTVDFPVLLKEIAKVIDVSEEDLLDLNPELRRGMVPPSVVNYSVRVPPGTRVLVERTIVSLRNRIEKGNLPAQHVVRSGDTLASIAKKYQLRLRDLANANNLSPREKVTPGSSLIIPRHNPARVTRVQRSLSNLTSNASFVIHVVKYGESLWSISEKYNVTVQDLFRWNGLKKSRLMPGKRLKIKSEKGAGYEEEA